MFKGDFELTIAHPMNKTMLTEERTPKKLLELIQAKQSKINKKMNSLE